jgi:hypothetical protein
MLAAIKDQIRLAAACEAARRLEECPADPKARGWYAEKVVARRLGAGLWADRIPFRLGFPRFFWRPRSSARVIS